MIALIGLIILALITITAVVLTETEYFGGAFILMLLIGVVAQLFHLSDLADWITNHSAHTALYVISYMLIGVLWSFVKWASFLMNVRDSFRNCKREFFAYKGMSDFLGPISDDLRDEFFRYARDHYRTDYKEFSSLKKPQAVENKSRIVAWMSMWPLSFIGTLLNDPVRKTFNWLFTSFRALYQKMSNSIFSQDTEMK